MTRPRTERRRRTWLPVLILLGSTGGAGASERPLAVRSLGPFTQIFGMPAYPDHAGPPAGAWEVGAVLDIVNHADQDAKSGEEIELDGETYTLNLNATWSLTERVHAGVEIPVMHHGGGFMDAPIENWHDLWGLSNSERDGPRDELFFGYADDGTVEYLLEDDATALGDVRLWSSWVLIDSGPTRVAVRGTLKLPTGDEDDLTGSGATDVALDVSGTHTLALDESSLTFSAYAGLLVLGNGEVIEDRQEDLVPYGGAGLVWQLEPNWDLLAQVQLQGAYYDSALDELGGNSTQVSLGVRYHWPAAGTEFVVSFVEDLVSDTTPDFTVGFELRKLLR